MLYNLIPTLLLKIDILIIKKEWKKMIFNTVDSCQLLFEDTTWCPICFFVQNNEETRPDINFMILLFSNNLVVNTI